MSTNVYWVICAKILQLNRIKAKLYLSSSPPLTVHSFYWHFPESIIHTHTLFPPWWRLGYLPWKITQCFKLLKHCLELGRGFWRFSKLIIYSRAWEWSMTFLENRQNVNSPHSLSALLPTGKTPVVIWKQLLCEFYFTKFSIFLLYLRSSEARMHTNHVDLEPIYLETCKKSSMSSYFRVFFGRKPRFHVIVGLKGDIVRKTVAISKTPTS